MSTLQLITAAPISPVTVAEQKLHMRVDITDDDTLISAQIAAATRWAENITGQRFINQVWKLWMDKFPDFVNWENISYSFLPSAVSYGQPSIMPLVIRNSDPNTIILPIGPVVSVDEVAYVDQNAASTVWSASNYVVDAVSLPARVVKKSDISWPSPSAGLQEVNAVSVKFTVGYGTATASMPEDIRAAIKLMAASLYENREGVSEVNFSELPMGVCALLAPYRMYQQGGM